jgi:glycosyltransferase involved in cell wall biosynthesis
VEILVITDRVYPGYPAGKRNYGMKMASGSIYAFIDSDAYPSEWWLQKALGWLDLYEAVCGPGILPPDAPVRERIADVVFQLLPYSYRVYPRTQRRVAEYPTFNLIVKKEVATPFPDYLTGEDSLFCRKITSKIFYHPDILVYHNRRPAFKRLWKQVGTYGKHRGNFIRLGLMAWLSSVFTYASNFIYGFIKRRPS